MLESKVKECPGCDTLTEKVLGCDHMTCTVWGCRTHWYWSCRKAFNEESISSHMDRDHSGWYANDEGDDW
jgi:hypothetical protein